MRAFLFRQVKEKWAFDKSKFMFETNFLITSFGKSWDLPKDALGLESNQNAFITC